MRPNAHHTTNQNAARMPLGPRPGKGSRPAMKRYIVTVKTEHYVEVEARDKAHAREQMQRRLGSEFGAHRATKITGVQEVSDAEVQG